MRPIAYLATEEQQIAREYERRRRLRLVQVIAPGFGGALLFVTVATFLYGLGHPEINRAPFPGFVGILAQLLIPACLVLYGLGTWLAWRRQISPAIACTILATAGPVVGGFLIYDSAQGLDLFVIVGMLTTVNLIILVGVMAPNPWVLISATCLGNVFTYLVLTYSLPAPGLEAIAAQRGIFVPLTLAIQWVSAILLLATGRTYLRTLRELGEMRVAYERAIKLDELKDQFITSVNHELRTPAMAMQGYLDLLRLTEDDLTGEERRAFLERASNASESMITLLTSILDARKLEQQIETLQLATVPLQAHINATIEQLGPAVLGTRMGDLHIAIADEITVVADPTRLRQVITNLLTNAIKYSPVGTPITISTRHNPGDATASIVTVIIQDHGLGIPPDQAPLLFNRFVRLPRDLASTTPGSGLGLYLSRRLIEGMHGTLHLESTGIEGEGTAFIIRLPSPMSA